VKSIRYSLSIIFQFSFIFIHFSYKTNQQLFSYLKCIIYHEVRQTQDFSSLKWPISVFLGFLEAGFEGFGSIKDKIEVTGWLG
jgi:hypothetical protein